MDAGAIASYAYTLDASGHRTGVTELSGRAVSYSYDNLYRLTNETIASDPHAVNGAASYVYDAVGNRTQKTSTLAGFPGGLTNYNANDQIATDTYDSNGNTTQSLGTGYLYDFENHLVQAGAGISYVYDGDGNRVSKTANGVTTTYIVDTLNPTGYAQVLFESYTGVSGVSYEISHAYTYGLELITEHRSYLNNDNWGSADLYFIYDGHGSVRALTDQTGAITDTYDYDAYGNLLNSTFTGTAATPNNYLFAGEQFDPDLGLYYNRARYLNVSTGRFWTMDDYEGQDIDALSLHKYLFANGDPVDGEDPTGHDDLASVVAGFTITTTLANMSVTTLGLWSAAQHGYQPSFGILSLGINGGAGGYMAEGGVDVLFNANEVDVFLVSGLGMSPLTLFQKFDVQRGGKVQSSWGLGVIIGLEDAEEYQEVETAATWPYSAVHLIPGAMFSQNKCWGMLTQLAKREHNASLSDWVIRVGLGESGSSMFEIGVNSNEFNWSVGGHVGPIFQAQWPDWLRSLLGGYSFSSMWNDMVAGSQ